MICFMNNLKQPFTTDFRGINGAENAPVIPRSVVKTALLAFKEMDKDKVLFFLV